MQKIDNCYAGFGTADVTVAVNDDETAYFMFYEAYGEQVVLGGIISNGVLNNRYDNTGMFNASVNYIWKSVDSTAWVPVE